MRAILIFGMAIFIGACASEGDNRTVGTESIDLPVDSEKGIDRSKLPEITFDQKVYETGKITQGEVLNFTYAFTNTGNAPLVISNVSGSCGCTIPRSYPTGKILPGEGGEIEVEFDSDNKWGEQTVSITVTANTVPSLTQLLIRTEIVVPDRMKNTN
jgi:hypothetical protein